MKVRPSLQDIAVKSGLSKTTVSLALRNSPLIKEETRRRVREIANALGYRPDPTLSLIAAHRWKASRGSFGVTLAFITTNHPELKTIPDVQAIAGARRQAEAFGYRLEHFRVEDYPSPIHLGKVLYNRGIRGIVVGKIMRPNFCDDFPWEQFSAIACNVGYYRPRLHLVMPDYAHAMAYAWNQAIDRGYERIGVVLFDEKSAIDEFDKTSAVLYSQSGVSRRQARIPVLYIKPRSPVALRGWLKTHRPDVVLGLNNAVHGWILDAGVRIPTDLGFISLITTPGGIGAEHISGVDYHPELMGQIAFEQLDIQMRTNQQGIPDRLLTLMMESHWVEGASLPQLKPGSVGRRKKARAE